MATSSAVGALPEQTTPLAKAHFAWMPDDRFIIARGFVPLDPKEKDPAKKRYALETRRVSDGKLVRSFPTRALVNFDLSPDGRFLVTVTANSVFSGVLNRFEVAVRDAVSGRELWKSSGEVSATDAEYSPDGTRIAVSNSRQIAILDAQTGTVQRTLRVPDHDGVFGFGDVLQWSADGKRLFLSDHTAVFVWNLS